MKAEKALPGEEGMTRLKVPEDGKAWRDIWEIIYDDRHKAPAMTWVSAPRSAE